MMVQVIARIHTTVQPVRRLIHNLLVRIGKHHPQALMYPLLVACKSQSSFRRQAAMSVVDAVRQHSATLVEQAQLVSPFIPLTNDRPLTCHDLLSYACMQTLPDAVQHTYGTLTCHRSIYG